MQNPEPSSPPDPSPSAEHADSLAEELPVSSPVPAYNSLSDSYLLPSKESEDLAEEAGATLASSSQDAPGETPLELTGLL